MSQMSKQKDIQDKEDSRFILGLAGWARERKEECVSGVAQARGGLGGGAICPQDLGRGPVECVRQVDRLNLPSTGMRHDTQRCVHAYLEVGKKLGYFRCRGIFFLSLSI